MSSFLVKSLSRPLAGEIVFPPDKSITHRAIILSSISQGKTVIKKFAFNEDCLATIDVFKCLGVKIEIKPPSLFVYGQGLKGLRQSSKAISTLESGTTMRILLGVLAAQPFSTTLVAAKSLLQRPMLRVIAPLRMMGAKISSRQKFKGKKVIEEYPPITISGRDLKPIIYRLPVASAQVKSAILLAGLYCEGTTKIFEPIKTRDHTERMLKLFRAKIKIKGRIVSITGDKELFSPSVIDIPSDISSASFFILAATFFPGSRLALKSVGLNPTRMGAIWVLKRMGADIQIRRKKSYGYGYEPVGDIIVRASELEGIKIKRNEMPSLIDEIPILMVAASIAKGKTLFEGVQELRVKETDRINSMVTNLIRMGVNIQIEEKKSGLNVIVTGAKHLVGAKVSSFGDHRTAMSMIIAGLKAEGHTIIDNVDCINKSFPEFLRVLKSLLQ